MGLIPHNVKHNNLLEQKPPVYATGSGVVFQTPASEVTGGTGFSGSATS